MGILNHQTISATIATLTIATNSFTSLFPEKLAQNNSAQRRQIIQESMIRGGCRPTQAAKAEQVLAILDTHKAQGMVLYSTEENLPATIEAIQSSRLPQLYVVACGWRATVEIGKATGYFFYELGHIPIEPPPRVERERRRTGEPIEPTPWIWVYRLGAPPQLDWTPQEDIDIPF